MSRFKFYRIIIGLLILLSLHPAAMLAALPEQPTPVESMDGVLPVGVLRLDPSISTLHIPPPAGYKRNAPARVQTATINVNYLPNGATDKFGNSCQAWPTQARNAFEYAADIWETQINSPVPIVVNACWTNLGNPDILGIGGADSYYRNFTNAPQSNTWYPTALANALAGSRMTGSTVDIHVAYNSIFSWYFGTDGNTPTDKVDLVSVVLHELCHGLGFAGSMTVNGGLGYWGWGQSPYPAGYDRFTENGAETPLLNFSNGSAALASQLTGGNLYFDGPNARVANGGTRPKLFAPSPWIQGSSYSHLDEIYNGTANDLMTYALPNGQSVHAPGPIVLGILQDIGWPLQGSTNTPPVLSGIPDLTLAPGQTMNNAIDLWAYASDDQDPDAALTFSIINTPMANAGVSIDSHRYIDINPLATFTATVSVEVQVMDTGGLTDTDTFVIDFRTVQRDKFIYLPLTMRSYGCNPAVPNGNFESGPTVWTQSSKLGWPLIINAGFPGTVKPHSGSWAVWLGGDDNEIAYIQQQLTIPSCAPYLAYYHWIASEDACDYDFAGVIINNTTVVDVYDLCADKNTGGWVKHVVDLRAYAGKTVQLQIRVETDGTYNSNLFVDDVAFQAGGATTQNVSFTINGEETGPRASSGYGNTMTAFPERMFGHK